MAKKKATKEDIKSFARELYMIPGRNGRRKNSCQKIADSILQKFCKSYSRDTILNWSKEFDSKGVSWEAQYIASIASGVTRSKIGKNAKEGKTAEETFQDVVAEDIKKQYKETEKIHNLQTYIVGSIFASTAGSIKDIVDKKYHGDIRKVPTNELLEIIPPILAKMICDSEKEMYSRLEKMRSVFPHKNNIGVEIFLKGIKDMKDDELVDMLGEEWKS